MKKDLKTVIQEYYSKIKDANKELTKRDKKHLKEESEQIDELVKALMS